MTQKPEELSADLNRCWYDIKSAPRDGQHIIGCIVGTSFGYYNGLPAPEVQTTIHWFDDPEEPGFYTSVNEVEPQHTFKATHWRPLERLYHFRPAPLAASPSPEGTRERGELVARTEALLLQVHDALEAARDKMRGACEPDDRAVYDQVNAALYALRGRPDLAAILALVSPLEGKGSSCTETAARGTTASRPDRPCKSEWRDIGSAPKNRVIEVWHDHNSDAYFIDGTNRLTTYGAHMEGLSCGFQPTGTYMAEWGGEWDDAEDGVIPDWWFVRESDWERPLAPTHWREMTPPAESGADGGGGGVPVHSLSAPAEQSSAPETEATCDLDFDEPDDCPNCGGEGYVSSCFEEYACLDPEEGCDLCMRRCDWCNNPADHGASVAAAERSEAGCVGTPATDAPSLPDSSCKPEGGRS